MPSLRSKRFVRDLEGSLDKLRGRADFRLVHYSIQRDHAHFLVEASDRHALGRGMKSLTLRLVRAVERAFELRGGVLADRYHLRILRTPREVRSALRYVLLNARRHATGRRVRWLVDPASSGRWFDGWRLGAHVPAGSRAGTLATGPPPPPPKGPRPVVDAHTWLLRVGWRRHGAIDPGDVPGSQPA